MKLKSWPASTGVKKGVSAEMTVSWEFFAHRAHFRALSTTETMAGSLCNAPKPPPSHPTPSRASTVAGDRLEAADLAIRTTEMVWWLCTSWCHLCRLVHKWCASRRMQLLLHQQHLNNITINLLTDAGRWGSCIRAIDEAKEEEAATHQHIQLELIDGRWPLGGEQHNNQPRNRIEGDSNKFMLQAAEKRGSKTQQPAKREGWGGCTIMLLCLLDA